MATSTRNYGEEIGDGTAHNGPVTGSLDSSETFMKQTSNESAEPMSSSSYILASDLSDLSADVDRWMNGSNTSSGMKTTGTQGSRVPLIQRSVVTLVRTANSLWYLVAMILPLFSVHNCVMTLRCTPSTVVSAAEVFVNHLRSMCSRAKAHIQRLAQDRYASEVFASTMDVILVVYAMGFLLLSVYQATMIG